MSEDSNVDVLTRAIELFVTAVRRQGQENNSIFSHLGVILSSKDLPQLAAEIVDNGGLIHTSCHCCRIKVWEESTGLKFRLFAFYIREKKDEAEWANAIFQIYLEEAKRQLKKSSHMA